MDDERTSTEDLRDMAENLRRRISEEEDRDARHSMRMMLERIHNDLSARSFDAR